MGFHILALIVASSYSKRKRLYENMFKSRGFPKVNLNRIETMMWQVGLLPVLSSPQNHPRDGKLIKGNLELRTS